MREIAAYVDDLVSRLECDPLKRDEIRLEAHLHLRELVDAEMAAGADAEAAQEAAIRQFGPVEEVAARLAMIHDLTPIPPAAVHRPGVVIGWGLVVAPVVVGVLMLWPTAILPGYLKWITMTAAGVALAALARWWATRRPVLVAGIVLTVGFWIPVGLWLAWSGPETWSGHRAVLFAVPAFRHYCAALAAVVVLSSVLRWVLRWLPRTLPRVHPALAGVGLVPAALWAHPYMIPDTAVTRSMSVEHEREIPTWVRRPHDTRVKIIPHEEWFALQQMLRLSRGAAAVAALWLALLTARGLCSGGARRVAVCAAVIMLGATAVPWAVMIPQLGPIQQWLSFPSWPLVAITLSYTLIMAAMAAMLAALVWAADNNRLPWPTKLEARMGV